MILAKAVIHTIDDPKKIEVEAQFNPAELSIHHSVRTETEKALSQNQEAQDKLPVGNVPDETTLNLTLYFDAYLMAQSLSKRPKQGRDIAGAAGSAKKTEWDVSSDELLDQFGNAVKELSRCVQDLKRMTRIHKDKHEPPKVQFLWGEFPSFTGHVNSVSVSYTMFDSSGSPTRAKVDVSLVGQEDALLREAGQKPNESPDRTKVRLLLETDQLWMLADSEYGDPAKWKVIADANEILNPRDIDRAVRLKLPSIR